MDNNLEEKKLATFIYKVKNDRQWYIENFLKIRDKNSQLIPFKYNNAQQEFEKIIAENTKNGKPHRYIVLKARQLGMSTWTEGYIFHDTSTRENVNSLIIAHEDKATQNLFNMSKLFYEELPPLLKPMKKYSNEKALVFENPTSDDIGKQANPGLRSKITIATAGTSDTARSGTFHNVHVSEIAFFPNPKNTMTALLQCVPDNPNTMVVMESTANGIGGYFYDMWNAACRGENDFTPIFFPWFTDPLYSKNFETPEIKKAFIKEVNRKIKDEKGNEERTEEYSIKQAYNLTYEQLYWRKWAIANKCGGDLLMFHQEYPSTPEEAFISSGRPRFNIQILREYDKKTTPPKMRVDLSTKLNKVGYYNNDEGYLSIWNLPQEGKYYTIGADVAEGLINGDYSVAIVLDDELNIVARWYGHIDPDLFGKQLVLLAKLYNDAYLAVENNNHGGTTLKAIVNEEYYNLFYTKTYDKINDVISKKLGWSTNEKTKRLMIDTLAEYVREKHLGIPDSLTISEMYCYVIDDKGRTNAQNGKHDDTVMAFAIALKAFLEEVNGTYMPEINLDKKKKNKRKDFDIPEIIDPLFESNEEEVEYSK
jgi:hypothetical protein